MFSQQKKHYISSADIHIITSDNSKATKACKIATLLIVTGAKDVVTANMDEATATQLERRNYSVFENR